MQSDDNGGTLRSPPPPISSFHTPLFVTHSVSYCVSSTFHCSLFLALKISFSFIYLFVFQFISVQTLEGRTFGVEDGPPAPPEIIFKGVFFVFSSLFPFL